MLKVYQTLFVVLLVVVCLCQATYAIAADVQLDGELKKWHRVSLTIDGPDSSELANENPFLDYRLDVVFRNEDQLFVVPGFYAADGNAAETSADSGNKWRVYFSPNKTGKWHYTIHFKKGTHVAVNHPSYAKASASEADGQTGSFTIVQTDKTGKDNRAKGRLFLHQRESAYLQFPETQKYFIKTGVDAPENFLAYDDFDATPNAKELRKSWQAHSQDFSNDARPFLWQGNKGKNILGVIKYLSSQGMNSFSFLTFNVDGDDRNVFPYVLKTSENEYEQYASNKRNKHAWEQYFYKTRFDVSKLAQWEKLFSYAGEQGMFLHFKTHEQETDHLMDRGAFDVEGKLYYRELIARFSHHLALNWNVSEENNQPVHWAKEVAEYIYTIDPYNHHRVLHTYPDESVRYEDYYGYQSHFTGASFQLSKSDFSDVHERVVTWRKKTNLLRKKWALSVDEPGGAKFALLPDNEDSEHKQARVNALWGALMGGAFGIEWYFGYASPHSDLTAQDFRSRHEFWKQNVHARQFFETYLPFTDMFPMDELAGDDSSYVFAKKDEIYAVFIHPDTKTSTINLGNSQKTFSVKWYDPRNGGELQDGSIVEVKAKGNVELGFAPNRQDMDWLVLLRAKDSAE